MFKQIGSVKAKALSLLQFHKTSVLTVLYGLVIIDAQFKELQSDVITFVLLGLYCYFIRIFSLNSKNTFVFCLILLGIMYVEFLLLGPAIKTEKTAVWLVLFMLVGIIQQWRE